MKITSSQDVHITTAEKLTQTQKESMFFLYEIDIHPSAIFPHESVLSNYGACFWNVDIILETTKC